MEFKLVRTCACAGRENLRDEGGTVFIPNGAVVMEMRWGQREERVGMAGLPGQGARMGWNVGGAEWSDRSPTYEIRSFHPSDCITWVT